MSSARGPLCRLPDAAPVTAAVGARELRRGELKVEATNCHQVTSFLAECPCQDLACRSAWSFWASALPTSSGDGPETRRAPQGLSKCLLTEQVSVLHLRADCSPLQSVFLRQSPDSPGCSKMPHINRPVLHRSPPTLILTQMRIPPQPSWHLGAGWNQLVHSEPFSQFPGDTIVNVASTIGGFPTSWGGAQFPALPPWGSAGPNHSPSTQTPDAPKSSWYISVSPWTRSDHQAWLSRRWLISQVA